MQSGLHHKNHSVVIIQADSAVQTSLKAGQNFSLRMFNHNIINIKVILLPLHLANANPMFG